MLESRVKICNLLGLHARAAAMLVKLAATFQSDIHLRRTDNSVVADAKSILSVLTLAASRGVELEITVEGEDETDALRAIENVFEQGFGEI